mgnify:CR=1 FL=1
MIYQVIRELIRLAAHVFFRRIELVGLENIPEGGANKEGVEGVHAIYNTSKDMVNKHYNKESDDVAIAEDFNKTYEKRLKIIK